MFRCFRFFSVILILRHACCVHTFDEEKPSEKNADQNINQENADAIRASIEKFVTIAAEAGRQQDDGVLPSEDNDAVYESMIEILNEITESVKNPTNAYKFLKNKGLDRIVSPNLMDIDDEFKTNVLILLKVLFDVAPTTTSALIPTSIVDSLLEIFDKENLALKAHALDILYLWLPGNPRVQTRVMKQKGLEPFYNQINKLDTAVIKKLLDLFNRILNEHLKIRNEIQMNRINPENSVIYQRIGLIERMSTPFVCNGLLNIFATSWSYKTNDNNLIITVLDLIKNVKQFCLKVFRGKAKAIDLFNALSEYVKDANTVSYLKANDVNVTEITSVIDDYVENVKLVLKDEF